MVTLIIILATVAVSLLCFTGSLDISRLMFNAYAVWHRFQRHIAAGGQKRRFYACSRHYGQDAARRDWRRRRFGLERESAVGWFWRRRRQCSRWRLRL